MLQNLASEEIEKAMEAFLGALPEGTLLQAHRFTPSIGGPAGPVVAFVLADNDEDLRRFQLVVDRGMAAFRDGIGMAASLERQLQVTSQHD